MEKLELPRGLIRYDTTTNQEIRACGQKQPSVRSHILRPRTYYYLTIMMLVGSVMLYGLLTRSPAELHVLHDRNPLFVTLSDGHIRNGYDVKILNKLHEDRSYRLSVDGIENAIVEVKGAGHLTPDSLPVFADSVGHIRVFLTAEKQSAHRKTITFRIEDLLTGQAWEQESLFMTAMED